MNLGDSLPSSASLSRLWHLSPGTIHDNEHVYLHRGNIKTVKNKITIKEKKRKKFFLNEIMNLSSYVP